MYFTCELPLSTHCHCTKCICSAIRNLNVCRLYGKYEASQDCQNQGPYPLH